MVRTAKLIGGALLAMTTSACVYMPSSGPTAPVGYASVAPQRDTSPANAAALGGAKVEVLQPILPNRIQTQRANAAFDEIVAANRAIGDAAPDFGFTFYRTAVRAWQGNDEAVLLVEGDGEAAIQYLFEPGSNTPLLIATSDAVYVFDGWMMIGALSPSGTAMAGPGLLEAEEVSQQLLVRGRTLYRVAMEGEPQAEYQQAAMPVTTVASSWSPWLYGGWSTFDPWYDSYRQRRESRERHERWRHWRRPDGHDRRTGPGRRQGGQPAGGRPGGHPGYAPPPRSDVGTPPPAGGLPPASREGRRPPREAEMRTPRPMPVEAQTFEADGTAAPVLRAPPMRRERAPVPTAPPSEPPASAAPPRFRAPPSAAAIPPPPAPQFEAPAPAPVPTPAPAYSPPPPPPPPPATAPPPPPPPPARNDAPRIAPSNDNGNERPD